MTVISQGLDNKTAILKRAERLLSLSENHGEKRQAKAVHHAITQAVEHNNYAFLEAFQQMKRFPVTLEEFITSKYFFGDQIEVWPTLWPDLIGMNPDVICGETPMHEALLGGATGTGKTTLCHCTNGYQLYLFTCYATPQRLFPDIRVPATPIVFMFQSVSSDVTRRVLYKPFRQMFVSMPYVDKFVGWDKHKESSLDLEGNLTVVPALASVESMVGQAIAGGMIDEANFMSVVSNSKRVPGPRGQGGTFDQAEDAYRNITRRRKSRFATKGISIGSICTLSSTRYKDDFMDRRQREVRDNNEQNVYVFRRKQYEVQPKYQDPSIKRFRLLVGNDRYHTRVLKDTDVEGVDFPAGGQIELVPVEYLTDFLRDPEGSLRDIVGVSTDTISAFIAQRHKIIDAIAEGNTIGLRHWVDRPDADLSEGMPQWIESALPPKSKRKQPRWAHVDLSAVKDRCGIAIIRPLGMVNVIDPKTNLVEVQPKFAVECVVTLKPSEINPVDIGEVRRWLMQLIAFYGINIVEISFDGWQSQESRTSLRHSGVQTRLISMDKTTEPYEYLRRSFYEDRMAMVDHEIVRVELANLEYHQDQDKVDHPPKGSKDAADAVCGAVYACATSRGLRAAVGFKDAQGRAFVKGSRQRSSRPRSERTRVNRV